jgi:NTP pyrophosphatase (non-canonical NTP hydrolase)
MKKEKEILSETWDRDGVLNFDYAIEEMAELIKALCKFREGRGNVEDIAKEIGDVQITIGVIEYINPEIVKEKREVCLDRLRDMLL